MKQTLQLFIVFISAFMLAPYTIFSQAESIVQKGNTPSPLHLGPSCQFSVLGLCFGDTTYFINQTIRMMKPSWKIEDSTGIIFSSPDTNIKFLFPSLGSYSVTVWADNGHPDSLTKIITISTTTKADFSFQQCSQQFVNMSTCATSFNWDFGDGNFSTNPMPVHFYSDTGGYTVQLIASNGIASDTLTQSIHVYSKGFPTGSFTYYQSNDTVYFFGDSIADNFNWDFGDTGTSILQNPAYAYADTGDYTVSHIVNNYCGLGLNFQVIHVFPPASVTSFQHKSDLAFSVYPNPFNEIAYMKIVHSNSSNFQIRIIDVFGREVFSEKMSNSDLFIIHRENLPSGIYFIHLLNDQNNFCSKKLIIH